MRALALHGPPLVHLVYRVRSPGPKLKDRDLRPGQSGVDLLDGLGLDSRPHRPYVAPQAGGFERRRAGYLLPPAPANS